MTEFGEVDEIPCIGELSPKAIFGNAMFKVTRYFVRQHMPEGSVQEAPFRSARDAADYARSLARRGLKADAFSVRGEPMFDFWEDPKPLGHLGQAQSPDGKPISGSNVVRFK